MEEISRWILECGLTTTNTNPKNLNKMKRKHAYDIERIEVKDPEYMSEVPEHLQNNDIPGFPSTILLVGRPGSGKTNVFATNMLLRKESSGLVFSTTSIYGPTVKNLNSIKTLKSKRINRRQNEDFFCFLPKKKKS